MRLRESAAFLCLALLVAACSGGSGSSAGSNTLPSTGGGSNGGSPTPQVKAKETISFRVPIKGKAKFKLTPFGHQGHPNYISPSTSTIAFTFDGAAQSFNVASPPSGPVSLGNGQTATYTSVVAGDYYQVGVSLTVLPGVHSIGLVLSDAANQPLSEATQSFTFAPGANPPATLILNGVLGSGFLCDWPSCDGGLGTPTNAGAPGSSPTYSLIAFPADVDGWVIMNQTDASNSPVPFANGVGFVVAEQDSNNIVNITQPNSPFTTPGTAATYNNNGGLGGPSGTWASGWPFTIQCQNVGTTTVQMQTSPGGTPLGTGVPTNPASTGFGVTVNCSSTGVITIQ